MAKKNPSVLWNVDQSGDVIGSTGRATAQGNIGLGSTIVTPNRDGKKFITHISRIGTPLTGEVAGELKANLDDVRLADIAATSTDATRSVVTDDNGKMTSMSMELDHSSGSADIVKDTTNPATTFVAEVSQTSQGKVTYTTKKIRSASDESDQYTGSHAGITALTSLMCPNGSRTTGITTAVTPTGVWNAIDSEIDTLDVDNLGPTDPGYDAAKSHITGFGRNKTLASLTETNGKISATFDTIAIDGSNINLTDGNRVVVTANDGTLTTKALTGTRSVVTDANGKLDIQDLEFADSSASSGNDTTTFVSSVTASHTGKISVTKGAVRTATDDTASTASQSGITSLRTTMLNGSSQRIETTNEAVTPKGVWNAIGTLTMNQVTQNLLSSSTDAEYPVILKYSTATSGSETNTVNYAAGVTVNPKDDSITAGKFLSTSGTSTCDLDGNGLQLSNSGSAGTLVSVGGITTGTGTFTSNCRMDGTLHVGNDTTGMYVDIDTNGLSVRNAQRPTAVTTLTDGLITTTGSADVYGDCWVGGKFSEGAKSGGTFTGEYVDIVSGAISLKSNTAGETLKYTTLDHTGMETNGTCWVAGKISEGAKSSGAYTGRYVEINDGVISTKNQGDAYKYTQIDYEGIDASGLIKAGAIKAGVAQYAGRYTVDNPNVYEWPADDTNLLLTAEYNNYVAIDLKNLTVGYVYWLHVGRNRIVHIRFSGGTVQRKIHIYENTWNIPVGDTSFWDINVRGNPAIPFIRASDDVIYVLLSY